MNKQHPPLRPAMTAIAALIALSSTPLLAQAADDGAAFGIPAAVASTPPDVPAADVATQATIAEPAVSADLTASAPAAPAMRTIGTPVEHTEDAPATAVASPVRRIIANSAAAHAARSSAPSALSTATRTAAPAAIVAPTSSPVIVAKTSPAHAAPAPAARVTPIANRASSQQNDGNDVLPLAGAVGLGLLAIGGGVVAFGRRRRRDPDDMTADRTTAYASIDQAVDPIVGEATPTVAVLATTAIAPAAATLTAASAPRDLANGFDLSRFGRHTQAAYRGPTPDNPSHSLRRRLKHASFFDQREREAAATAQTPQPREPIYAAAETPPVQEGQITVRLAPQRTANRFGYVLQK